MPAFSKIVKFKDYYYGVRVDSPSYSSYYTKEVWRSTNKTNWQLFRSPYWLDNNIYYPDTDIAVTENRLWILDYGYSSSSSSTNTSKLWYSTDGSQLYQAMSGAYLGPMLAIGGKLFLCKKYSTYGRSGYYFTANEGSSWSSFDSPDTSSNSCVVECPSSGYPAEVRSYYSGGTETIKLCIYNGSSWVNTALPVLPESEYDPETYEEISYYYGDPIFCGTKVVIPVRRSEGD